MGDQPVDIDWQIVDRLAAREPEAMDVLYERYARPLYAYLLQLAGDHTLAEEILQDTFVATWKSATSFQRRSSVKTWLFGIARRQAWNTLRRKRLNMVDDSVLAEMSSDEPEPDTAAIANAERAEISRALNALGSLHREVLLLTFIEGLSLRETAEILSVPVGTVKSRLSNAKRALKHSLENPKGVRQL